MLTALVPGGLIPITATLATAHFNMQVAALKSIEEVASWTCCAAGDVAVLGTEQCQPDGELDGEMSFRVQAGWSNSKSVSGVLCVRKMLMRLKGKVYRMVVRSVLLYGVET